MLVTTDWTPAVGDRVPRVRRRRQAKAIVHTKRPHPLAGIGPRISISDGRTLYVESTAGNNTQPPGQGSSSQSPIQQENWGAQSRCHVPIYGQGLPRGIARGERRTHLRKQSTALSLPGDSPPHPIVPSAYLEKTYPFAWLHLRIPPKRIARREELLEAHPARAFQNDLRPSSRVPVHTIISLPSPTPPLSPTHVRPPHAKRYAEPNHPDRGYRRSWSLR